MNIILASKSPRRLEILRQIGVSPIVIIPNVDESICTKTEPAALTEELSRLKAHAINDEGFIIAADTVVAIDGNILGKPSSKKDAKDMLKMLSGRCHKVFTGYTLIYKGRDFTSHTESRVYFRALDDKIIDGYVQSGEPMDKAGGYGIQGLGAPLVEKIEGDYFNIVGLPISDIVYNARKIFNIYLGEKE